MSKKRWWKRNECDLGRAQGEHVGKDSGAAVKQSEPASTTEPVTAEVSPPPSGTWREIVREVAAEFQRGIVSDDEADYILWEHTGFPSFFDGDPATVCRQQVREFFSSLYGGKESP